ncbi:MAG TPA: serine hydrolase [Longimicrobiales bacterium]|nr:serine hydrolase [Longimicrobiales bacterium]
MRRRILTPLLVLCAACAQPASRDGGAGNDGAAFRARVERAQAFASDLAPLEAAIRERVGRETGEYGIAVIDVETGRSLGVNDRLVMHAASTMKVPVLLELYRRAADGRIALDDGVLVKNTFRSIADTSHYTLTTADDSEHALYGMIGQRVTYRELARRMTVRSSNLATNILIDILTGDSVQATTERVGGFGMRVLRGVEDGPAFRAGMNNVATARGLANVLASLARCDILPRAQCDEVVDILAAQEFNDMIPAGLPPGTRVAHKTGWITGIQHDGAIVMPDGEQPYVLVVLTRGAADTLTVRRVAADVARLTWQALGPDGSLRADWPAQTAELLALHRRVRVPAFPAPTLRHAELWRAFEPALRGNGVRVESIGTSAEGRELRLLAWGTGPEKVLFWSQMHGDETTASRALADLFSYLAGSDDARVRQWRERLTILAVPMLNPDGAEAHTRRSAFGVDVNRDARLLSTPEARALKGVQERHQPDYGFNLHDQNPRSRAGTSLRTAAISLLAPLPDAEGTLTPGLTTARRMSAHLTAALAPLVGAHLTQYDDSYNPRAFGDGMQTWGVSAVLIETGSWKGDESKHYLRAANFVALVTALDAIATGAHENADPALYQSLPGNGRSLSDLLIRGGSIALPGMPPYRADISIDAAAVGGPAFTQVTDVGDLEFVIARDTIDASGLFIHAARVRPGDAPRLLIRSGAAADAPVVWEIEGVRARQLGIVR